MEELRKLVFEKIKLETLRMNKSDYATLVEKGRELGIDELRVKKLVSSSLKKIRIFKTRTIPLSILEERNVELEADELYIPKDILNIWFEEGKVKLIQLEDILASNDQEKLQSFLIDNPELESASKVSLSYFVKSLHKDSNDLSSINKLNAPTPVSADTFEKEDTASLIESVKIKEESSEKSSGKDNKSKNLFLGIGVFFVFLVGGIISFILLWDSDPLNAYYQDEFEYQMIVDSRDGQKYRTIQVGSQNWMAQNLNYAANGSICDSCELYGRLYTYETAKNSCPTGYTLPTLADLKILKSTVGYANALFSKKGWENQGVDENGMAIIPGGFFSIQDGIIKRRGEMAGFWSITDYDEFAVRVKLDNYSSDISIGGLKKQYGFSVRCISEETSINSKENDIVIDSRNKKILETITIGNQKWLASNIDVKLKKSYCPYDSDSYCESYGRLYEWSAAKNACPKGYRLPNAADFAQLSSSMEKETFNPLYAGFRNKNNTELFGKKADFWTASVDGKRAVYFYSKPEETTFLPSTFNKKAAMSVRCIEGVLEQDFNYSYITDERDNQVYKTVKIGNQEWMAENLNFALDGTYCYDNDEANCEKYGRLYVWTDAANLCPEGWHLPTDEEWIELKNYVSNNGNEKIGTNLRSIDHWKSGPGTDLFGLALVPSGCYLSTKDSFVRLGERAYIWSATEFDSDSVSHWTVTGDMEDLLRVTVYKKQARAVRCIRD